ncbi:hypothetical protein E2C01_072157 [Portunus trituberculatus]|uniref:Peptidase M12B propeptide domain-containing protein n=1 Tax=Portunus trituberculatus TaxID=210409 RepID=A0A5B7I6F0_PORTR|nr:hypothetical protein [Portunus trituberculatus]
MRVSSDGAFLSHHLHHTHHPSRAKRDARTADHELHYILNLDGEEHQNISQSFIPPPPTPHAPPTPPTVAPSTIVAPLRHSRKLFSKTKVYR